MPQNSRSGKFYVVQKRPSVDVELLNYEMFGRAIHNLFSTATNFIAGDPSGYSLRTSHEVSWHEKWETGSVDLEGTHQKHFNRRTRPVFFVTEE